MSSTQAIVPVLFAALLGAALGCATKQARNGEADADGGAFDGGGSLWGGVPAGGRSALGGMGSAGARSPSSAGAGAGGCALSVTYTLSSEIPTVGSVEWSAGSVSPKSASIEYGLDTSYGMTAPVDLSAPNRRTLLLGLKTARTYHFRVVAEVGAERCVSADYSLTTGPAPNGFPLPEIVTNASPERLDRGYLVTARWVDGGPVFILDGDGDLVWWYAADDDVIRARMSYDGKHMWFRNTAQVGGGVVRRVSMDGLEEDRWLVPDTTHDLAVIPDGKLGLVGHAPNGCDEILEFDPETAKLTSIFNATQASKNDECHVNYLAYYEPDDSFVFSDYRDSSFVKLSRAGELVWILNGEHSHFTGTDWSKQHGIHMLAADRVLLFSNGESGDDAPVLEYLLNLEGKTATLAWRYDGGQEVAHGGDVQRLDNGNTLITYSSAGVVHEVSPDGELLQSMTWSIGGSVSYSEKRRSLYGPPPKLGRVP